MEALTWDQVRRRRLARHSLLQRMPRERLLDAVSGTCGIHAQVMTAAELSIGVRVELTRSAVRKALWDERRLCKTYGIRGTIHLFPASEVALWMAAARARAARSARDEARRLQYLGLEPAQVVELVAAIRGALDGRVLTLRELGDEVVGRTGPWAAQTRNEAWVSGWPLWRTALGTAAAAGALCFGPGRGNEVTFTRPDQWLPEWHEVDADAALREVFRRYLQAFGPIGHGHFAAWFNLPPPAARDLVASLRRELVEVDVEGTRLFLAEADVDGYMEPAGSLRLLPHFDCYLRGFHPRQQLTGGHEERAAGGTGRFPVLLIDGMVAGVWERRTRRNGVEVRVEPFVRLTGELRRRLEVEAFRIGEILEREAELTVGPVAVRAHL
jgi:hypothetical protein